MILYVTFKMKNKGMQASGTKVRVLPKMPRQKIAFQ